MRTEVALQLGVCALCLTLMLLGQGMGATLPKPPQVQCVWSSWSEWGACDPCTRSQRRSRSIEVFGQFGGEPCKGSLGEKQFCVTNAKCDKPSPPACPDTKFQCDSGTCISRRLVCNGDFDCEDSSDEPEDCEPSHRPCGTLVLDSNEQGRTAGYGINILGADPRMNPFNNEYFNGRCSRVMNPNTRRSDRIPWNVGVLSYQTLVEETVSREIYEDTHSLLREILKEMNVKVDIGFSFKFQPTEPSMSNVSVNANFNVDHQYEKKTMIKHVTEYTTVKNKSFMRVKGRVQLSTYRLRSRDLNVAEEFLEHIASLPLAYEKSIYFAFLEDYGTHYTKNGKSGGEYELVYVLNQDTIRTKNLTERKIQECVKLGISGGVGISAVDIGGKVEREKCDPVTNKDEVGTEGKAVIDKVMTSVKGGTLEAAAAMKATLDKNGVMDVPTYQNWARSIADAPALINSESEPIYMLVPTDMPDANTRISNLKQATAEYVAQYNVCKCKPCQNGGTLALLDGQCICLCPNLFEGVACQDFKADKAKTPVTRPDAQHEGNWSCWSSWSSCSGEKRSRTRTCNRDGVPDAPCRGVSYNEEHCQPE